MESLSRGTFLVFVTILHQLFFVPSASISSVYFSPLLDTLAIYIFTFAKSLHAQLTVRKGLFMRRQILTDVGSIDRG